MPNLIPIEKTVKYTVYGRYCAKDFRAGEYCRFVAFKKFQRDPICTLYRHKELSEDPENGYLIERCQECLNDWE